MQQISRVGIIRFPVSLSCQFRTGGPALGSLFPEFYDRALDELVRARQKAGVTQAALAKQLGRPQSFVAKYEGRERRLDVAEFVSIARLLGADPARLLKAAESATR